MMLNGLITALRTLTILPVPGRESDDFASSLPWFPVAGLFLGAILALSGQLWILIMKDWAGGGAVLLLAGMILLTRGLHMDGLADWADALGGRPDRETRLAIMKDSGLGAFGVLALITDLIAKWIAFERIIVFESPWILLLPLIVSRAMMVELAAILPYARSGTGTGEPFVHGSSRRRRFIALILGLLLSISWGTAGLIVFSAGWAATRLFAVHCSKVFGGVTGDLLGALNEILETGLLLLCACVLPGPATLWYTVPGFF